MFKNVQIKIVLLFFLVGFILLTLLTAFFNIGFYELSQNIVEESRGLLQSWQETMNVIFFICYMILGTVCIAIGIFLSKVIISPVNKLIANAEKIAKGEKIEEELGNKQEDALTSALSTMTEELKENLNEVVRQKKQIETILLHMTDGIIAFNMEGKVILINPAATRALEVLPSEVSFDAIFGKLDLDINMEKIIYLEDWTSSKKRIQIKDKYINLFFATFKDENDRPAGVTVVLQDITEHVKLDNMRKEFVADVSHELKTPITSIMGYADTLMESEYDKEMQTKFLGVISAEARRMAKLVTDLLTLSRYDNNQNTVEKTEFDLGNLVKKCQENLQLEIEKKKQHIECFVTANVPPVYAEKDGIERVIINILTNSIKYTKEEGTIKIYVGFVYNDAYIKIIDNGIGIPEQDLNRIFERFYRVDKSRTREMGGTGLGLSIAKEILDRNKGSIDIKSKVGEGTEVVLRIPTKQ